MATLVILLVALPLAGIVAGFLLTARRVLSGRLALGLSLLPVAGVALGMIYC